MVMSRWTILCLFLGSCSTLEQNDLMEQKTLSNIDDGAILFKQYQTGIDNYRFEFYHVNKDTGDTIKLFESYLNDAVYNNLKFIVKESEDTIKIKSNKDLGYLTEKIADRVFVLQKQIDPFDKLGFTVHGESGKVTQLMLYDDSVSSLSDLEIQIHRKIWDQIEVDSIARSLRDNNIKAFTLIETYPTTDNDYYLIKFGQVASEKLPHIFYYKVDRESMRVQKVEKVR